MIKLNKQPVDYPLLYDSFQLVRPADQSSFADYRQNSQIYKRFSRDEFKNKEPHIFDSSPSYMMYLFKFSVGNIFFNTWILF